MNEARGYLHCENDLIFSAIIIRCPSQHDAKLPTECSFYTPHWKKKKKYFHRRGRVSLTILLPDNLSSFRWTSKTLTNIQTASLRNYQKSVRVSARRSFASMIADRKTEWNRWRRKQWTSQKDNKKRANLAGDRTKKVFTILMLASSPIPMVWRRTM